MSLLTEADVSLIEGGSAGYIVKFRALELWGELTSWLKKCIIR
jgi:hypothetical protein